jgi:hypothetical protein
VLAGLEQIHGVKVVQQQLLTYTTNTSTTVCGQSGGGGGGECTCGTTLPQLQHCLNKVVVPG